LKLLDLNLVPSEEVENIICEDVTQEDVADILTYVIPQMIGICAALNGYGLAAPQVGIKKKFFIIYNQDKKDFDIYFNMKYFKDGSRSASKEGCLSYDSGKRQNVVKRYKSIKIVGQELDSNMNLIDCSFKESGIKSIAFQHEIDHLYGRTIFTK